MKKKEIKVEEAPKWVESMQKYINNRCLKKPKRNKSPFTKFNNKGLPINLGYFMGNLSKNYAVIFLPKRRKLKGWQRNSK